MGSSAIRPSRDSLVPDSYRPLPQIIKASGEIHQRRFRFHAPKSRATSYVTLRSTNLHSLALKLLGGQVLELGFYPNAQLPD